MRGFLFVIGVSALLSRGRSQAKGLDNVIGVLKEMLTKFNTQMDSDKSNWEAYQTLSDEQTKDRTTFVQNQQGGVMSATAGLNANQMQVQSLTATIADLGTEIAQTEQSMRELDELRASEHTAHEDEMTDLTHTIEAVNRAVEVLEGHAAAASVAQVKADVTKALSALAVSRSSLSARFNNFLESPDWLNTDGSQYATPSAASTGGVMGTLKSIRQTLSDNRQGSITKENEARRQYEEAKAAKNHDLSSSREQKVTKESALETAKASIDAFTAQINQANADIADAQHTLAFITESLATYSHEFDGRVADRNQEVAATTSALDALQAVTAGAKGAVEGAFIQLARRGVSCRRCPEVVQNLLKVGEQCKNAALVQLASAIKSKTANFYDPEAMAPVRDLLHNLITKLEEELSAETSHKEWCDTEKAQSAVAKETREHSIGALTAEIETGTTQIAQLTSEIAFLAAELTRVSQETAEATQIRTQQHAAFVQAKRDHDEVIGALGQAMSALSGQYALFVQVGARKLGSSPFSAYSSGDGGSALAMLQDLHNKYSSALTELESGETQTAAAHETLLASNEQFRRDTQQTKQAKETEKRTTSERLADAKTELSANQHELAEVVQYLADLRPSCDDIRATFEERKHRREAEIDALKETVAVLEDPTTGR